MVLYKYRGIKELRYFIDIVLNQRLYAAPYSDLNDPMEGHYFYNKGELDFNIRNLIRDEKQKLRICSLSKIHDNELMWAHYAEGHRGIAIGVKEINKDKYDVQTIKYNGLPHIDGQLREKGLTAKKILSHKLEVWEYESEVRVFTNEEDYVDVKVKEVLLGKRMKPEDKDFIKKLVSSIDSEIRIKEIDPL